MGKSVPTVSIIVCVMLSIIIIMITKLDIFVVTFSDINKPANIHFRLLRQVQPVQGYIIETRLLFKIFMSLPAMNIQSFKQS